MIHFGDAHKRVHLPDDRRVVAILRHRYIIWVTVLIVLPIALAWLQVLTFGIHSAFAPIAGITGSGPIGAPRGFPVWIRWTHFANMFFIFLLMHSGLSILMDHPRLYWNNDCTPGSEWLRLTPLTVPNDRVWTAKEDARYISPLLGLPCYRHTIGMGRSWHFITDYGFILTGAVYVIMLLISGQWPRLIPTSWAIFPHAWQTFVHYATFHLRIEPNGYCAYNALQQLTYFAVVFVMAPLSILTGIAMSPAVDIAFPWYPRIFGGRQGSRSIHFLLLCGYIAFTIVHVTLIFATGAKRNFNHIVLGANDSHSLGLILGGVGIAVVVASWVAAYVVAWRYPRAIQYLHKLFILPLELGLSGMKRFNPAERYRQ